MKYHIAIALLLASCQGTEEKTTTQEATVSEATVTLTAAQYKNAALTTGKAEQKMISTSIKLTGKIDVPPQNMVSVSFPLGGYLKSTKLLPGMPVRKGEVIAVMEDQQYIQLQQDYLTAKARHDYLKNEYQRQKELNKSKASSDKIYQQAEADYKSNQILINGLQQKLQLIGINPVQLTESNISRSVYVRATIDGYVSAVKANIGRYVSPTDVLFELVNPEDIHLVLHVFEKDLPKLQIGQKLVAYTNTNPDKKYPCDILLIGHQVSSEKSVEVHCHFERYDRTLVPGMYMNAEIETANTNAYLVPEEAVVRYENKQYVFIEKDKLHYEMKEVTTGEADDGLIALTEAKDVDIANATIVTSNAYTLLMMLKNTAE